MGDSKPKEDAGTIAQIPLADSDLARLASELAQTNERLQVAFDAMTDGLVIQGSDGQILTSNKAAQRILGLTEDQFHGRSSFDPRCHTIHPDGSPFPGEDHPAMVALRTKQPVYDVIMGVHKPDGQTCWIRVFAIPMPKSGSVLVTFSDITEQKRAEGNLHFQAELLRAVGQSVYATDLLGRVTYINAAAEALYGWKKEEVLGKSILSVAVAPGKEPEANALLDRIRRGESWRGEFPLRRKDGHRFLAEVVGTPALSSSGKVIGLVGISQDITARKNAEAALLESEALLRSIADGVPIAILRWDRKLRLTFINHAGEQIAGKPREELLGKHYPDVMTEALYRRNLPALQAALHGIPSEYEIAPPTPVAQDKTRWYWIKYIPHIIGNEVTGILVLATDITQMKRDAALQTQLSEIVESASDAIVRAGRDGVVQAWNAAAERLYGYSAAEMIGESFDKLIPTELLPAAQNIVARALQGERIGQFETRRQRKDGSLADVELTVSPVRDACGDIVAVSAIVRDLSARKLLERQLEDARRLETIGRLAGGIAHDFNNILQVMMLHLEHLERQTHLPGSLLPSIKQLEHLADRAAKVTSQLLLFARKQTVQMQTIDANAVLQQTASLLSRILGEHIDLRTKLSPFALWTEADSSMLDQVILNLCINARDAMPQGGMLELSSAMESWEGAPPERFPEAQPGRYVLLTVSDSGCGMSGDVLSHLFEPFFTTKDAGKGTGLGLAAVYGIVKQHHGFIVVDSTVGQGSTFRIYFPWSDKVQPPHDTSQQTANTEPTNPYTLLLVEDEDMLRQIGVAMLTSEGFRVLAVADGRQALRVFDAHHDEIDLLISDMVMPGGISGMDLATTLRVRNPKLPIILMSGYSEEIITAESNPQTHIEFLAKPFRYPELLLQIRRCLPHS